MSGPTTPVLPRTAELIARPSIEGLAPAAAEIASAWVRREELGADHAASLAIYRAVYESLEALRPVVAAYLGREVHRRMATGGTHETGAKLSALNSWTRTLETWAADTILPPEAQEEAERS